jgi:hypothetical protein
MSITQINDFLSDLWNFHLFLTGIGITVFTLLYSFILSKRGELYTISQQIKSKGIDPTLKQQESFAKKYILKFKKANDQSVALIILGFSLFFFTWSSRRLVPDCLYQIKLYLLFCISSLTILTIGYLGVIFFKIYRNYTADTKI